MTRRRKILFLIPFIIIGVILSFTWLDIITTDDLAIWKHYVALLFYIIIAILLFKDKTFKTSLVLTAIFIVLSAFNIISPFTHTYSSYSITLGGSFKIPLLGIDMSCLPIIILFFILNFDSLVDIYLDYKESKNKL